MAVDDLRNTYHINRVAARDIGLLLSAQSYRPEITNAIRQIKAFGKWDSLQNLCSNMISPGPHPVYANAGHPCLKTKNVTGLIISTDEFDWVEPQSASSLKKYFVANENVLLNLTGAGSIGRAAIYFGSDLPLTNQHIARLDINCQNDPAYVCCFLSSWWGERAIEQGISGSTGQLNLVNDHVRSLPVLLPEFAAQRYIGDKVRQAERLRTRARKAEREIQSFFAPFMTQLLVPQRSWRASASLVDSYRINAPHYDPVVLDMLKRAVAQVQLAELAEVIGERGVSGGATPKGAIYIETGVFFVRVQNVKPLRLDLSDAVFIDKAADEELARSRCQAGEVILTITGYPGTAAIVLEEDLPLNINQHSVRFDVKAEWQPEYVVAALNSEFVKRQVDRLAIGGTRDALDYNSVRSLVIPILDKEVREQIAHLVRFSNVAVRNSTRLTVAAKLLVEALIEGKLSESELKEAQEALERGEREADRAILARLTRKGVDIAGEPPLFPDLDALYVALDQTSETTPQNQYEEVGK